MPVPTDLNLPALVSLLQATATHLETAAQFQAGWRAARPPRWGIQRRQEPERDCAACGLPIALGQPYWIWLEAEGRVTHAGLPACASVALALIGLAGATWGLHEGR
jgi:hypothetical protein